VRSKLLHPLAQREEDRLSDLDGLISQTEEIKVVTRMKTEKGDLLAGPAVFNLVVRYACSVQTKQK
jgi:hypothetical protein